MKLNPLTQKISKHFSLHPSRQNTMAAMIFSVLCSNNVHHQSLAKYRERWAIEELFRKLKTSGFHWENTHMIYSTRLISLLIILSFGVLIACLMGQEQKIPWKKTLDCLLYSVFKEGLIRFQFLLAQSVVGVLEILSNLLELPKNGTF